MEVEILPVVLRNKNKIKAQLCRYISPIIKELMRNPNKAMEL